MRVRGTVVRGLGKGRLLGYPTINIEYDGAEHLSSGIYEGWATLAGTSQAYRAAIVIGGDFRTDAPMKLEAHLLDFEGDAYGCAVVLSIGEKIRDVQKFSNQEALIARIEQDITAIRATTEHSFLDMQQSHKNT